MWVWCDCPFAAPANQKYTRAVAGTQVDRTRFCGRELQTVGISCVPFRGEWEYGNCSPYARTSDRTSVAALPLVGGPVEGGALRQLGAGTPSLAQASTPEFAPASTTARVTEPPETSQI
jgi:hypothetical protein